MGSGLNRAYERQESAHFEYISIPSGESFLWRMDDYPWRQCVWNYHPEFEIHLIRHSSGLSYVGDFIGSFDAGQLVLVGSNLPHNWISPSIGKEKLLARDIVVQFDPDRIRRTARELPELSNLEPLFQKAALGLEFLGETAVKGAAILEGMGGVDGILRLGGLIELLGLMAQSEEIRTLATPQFIAQFQPGRSHELEILSRALDYLQANYLNDPKLSEVALKFGMSESSFSRFFKAQTGNTFSDHLTSLRIWTARKLLADSDLAITDICYEAGYANISNFNRIFIKQVGMTPSRYRRAARLRNNAKESRLD
jgi:AraC-like DNA-binding protein